MCDGLSLKEFWAGGQEEHGEESNHWFLTL